MELMISQATTLFTEVLLVWTPNDLSKVTVATKYDVTVAIDGEEGETFEITMDDLSVDYPIQTTRLFLNPMQIGLRCQVTMTDARIMKCDVSSTPLTSFAKKAIISYLDIRYRGHVEFKCCVDGQTLVHPVAENISDPTGEWFSLGKVSEPPVESFQRIYLPAGIIGFMPQLFSVKEMNTGDNEIISYEFGKQSLEDVSVRRLFHYVEVCFKGAVRISVWLDGTKVVGWVNFPDKGLRTVKLYLPPLSFGNNLQLVSDHSFQGQIVSVQPASALPASFNVLRTLDKGAIVFQGNITVSFEMDGTGIDDYTFSGVAGQYQVQTIQFPAGVAGYIFQWQQTEGEGTVEMVKTNDTFPDRQTPNNIQG